MPSTMSQASWHPAFMPNSISDLRRNENDHKSETSFAQSRSPGVEHVLEEDTNHGMITERQGESQFPPSEGADGEELPELGSLRSALKKSLGSPGGVEMAENPVHAGTAELGDTGIEMNDSANNDKGEFPSERPAHEPGHASSASFARTIPRDMDWGEDDEVDPEWNLQRADTDPFKMMPASDRTNSFPQVPPIHLPANSDFNHELPKSQAEDIIHRSERASDFFAGDEKDGFFDKVAGGKGFADGDGHNSPEEPAFESRYEEGIPLVGSSEAPQMFTEDGGAERPSLFSETDAHNDDDFFGSMAATGQTIDHPMLGRKSTMQVINSIDLRSSGASSSQPTGAINSWDLGISQNTGEKVTQEDIADSRSALPSQPLAEPGIDLGNRGKDRAAASGEPIAEDLTAKWKAALDGDELLDEDELLGEETGVEASAVDPTTLFGSDDEGFLEDDEPIANGNGTSQLVPSLPAFSSDGRTVGLNNPTSGIQSQQNTSNNRYVPPSAVQASVQASVQPSNIALIPHAPLLTDLTAQPTRSSMPYGVSPGAFVTSPPPASYSAPQQQRPSASKNSTQSFADKSKGGYASPYDLPMEVVKPRKRASMQQMGRRYSNANPPDAVLPPRSNSMVAQGPPPSRGSASSLSPPISSSTLTQQPSKPPQLPPSASQTGAPTPKAKGSFFEELPITSRQKPAGRYTPQPSPTSSNERPTYSDRAPPQTIPPQASHYMPPPPASQLPPAAHGLVAPPRASPYASLPTAHSQPPLPTSRYSPAPVRSSSGSAPPPPVAHGRYATAPSLQHQQSSSSARSTGSAPSPPPPILPHQPRTSSPLIHFERAQDEHSFGVQNTFHETTGTLRRESSGFDRGLRSTSLPTTQEIDESRPDQNTHSSDSRLDWTPQQDGPRKASSNSSQAGPKTLPYNFQTPQYSQQDNPVQSKRATSNYVPNYQPDSFNQGTDFVPPIRSQTQSPSKVMAGPHPEMGVAHSPTSPRKNEPYGVMAATSTRTRTRGFSQGLNYIAPTDGREQDPLQRWRGGPVFAWGVGGTVMTSFPKEVPRYGMSQTMPMIICSPGEIKIRSLKDIYPLGERLASFPGPLKGKSKKKELITWLTTGIEILERDAMYLRSIPTLSHEDKRKEERVLLWKILRVMIENDGLLEGNPNVNKAIRAVLTPGLDSDESVATPQYATGADLSGISRAPGATIKSEPVDPASVDALRKHLLRGEREEAVWEAVDKRLWAHALLISHTLSKDIHKQVAQEFIQKEVKSIGENTESLAVLYEIFAGNFEESIDELVPPSARAGFQMVSTTASSGHAKSSVEGLDRWRETLGLILSNRSPEDSQAINALGKLLSGYGRAEASHICYLFARGYSLFGGIDDPMSNIVLVGSDHLRQPNEFDKELEPILLSEVYEYGLSLYTTSNVAFSAPHLAAYKLQHATILAQSGQRDKALQYCEAIATSITSQVRRSPYHHALLVAALDDLSKRLKQSPKDESSSWISKPSIDKVSGSVWAKFNKFVAGEENDAASGTGSDAGSEIGIFAKIAGDTPIISRSPSNGDIYASLNGAPVNGGIAQLAPMKSASRYAPGSVYAPPNTQDTLSSSYGSPPQASFLHRPPVEDSHRQQRAKMDRGSAMQPLASNDQISQNYPDSVQGASYGQYSQYGFQNQGVPSTLQPPTAPPYEQQASSSYNGSPLSLPVSENDLSSAGYMPPSRDYEQPSDLGNELPSSRGYEPPSYEPATMNDEPDSPIDTRPKKKSFMDDDDDGYEPPKSTATESTPSPSAKVEKTKAEKDREADEAFRKAAEADAKKDAQSAPAKRGWGLGGWFARKETPSDTPQPNKPIRAKLGEESSFYYDPDLKRWVNKKAGKDGVSDASSAAPPPPKGPPRTATASPSEPTLAPKPIATSAPPQRAASASAFITSNLSQSFDRPSSSGLSVPPPSGGSLPMSRSISNGSAAGGPPSGPPSRPTTSMSNASSIDDLLGPPTARKGGTVKKSKKGRGYIDVMGEKAST